MEKQRGREGGRFKVIIWGASHKWETNFWGGSGPQPPWKGPEYLYQLFDILPKLAARPIPEKTQTGRVEDILSWKKTWIFLFLSLSLEIPDKTKLPPANFAKLYYTPCKFKAQKSRPTENPHNFFLITPVNPTSILIDL